MPPDPEFSEAEVEATVTELLREFGLPLDSDLPEAPVSKPPFESDGFEPASEVPRPRTKKSHR